MTRNQRDGFQHIVFLQVILLRVQTEALCRNTSVFNFVKAASIKTNGVGPRLASHFLQHTAYGRAIRAARQKCGALIIALGASHAVPQNPMKTLGLSFKVITRFIAILQCPIKAF